MKTAGAAPASLRPTGVPAAEDVVWGDHFCKAHDHLMVIQRVMARLNEAATPADLSAAAVGEAERALGATRVAVLVEEHGAWRDLATGETTAAPPDATRPLWLGSAAAIERERPALAALSPRAAAVLPLIVRGKRVGVLALGFAEECGFDASVKALAALLAQQIAHALDRARAHEAATQASRARDELLAMLSHELRNPLAPILTATQLMRLRGEHACARERAIIERQARNLVRIVDDLLDASRIIRGEVALERRPLELAGVLAEAIEQARPELEERGHRPEIDVPPGLVIDGDPARMAQVFASLLGNAAKATPRGGRITVEARPAGAGITVVVRDQGEGIEPALLPHVFEVFVQGAQGRDRARGGLGVGLAVARSIVTLHGGAIRAESDGPGCGAVFTVELPRPPAAGGQAAATAPRDRTPMRLLLVDDNQDAADLLALSLTKLGHDVRVAYDPRSALALALDQPPDVAVLDIGLPDMDGHELAGALRAQHPGAPIVLIALSGYGDPADRARSVAAGFSAHLVKPADLATIHGTIARACAER